MAEVKTDGNNLSANLGRITVAYISDKKCIRVVLSSTGEQLREDECGELNVQSFRSVVQKYERMMEAK